MFHATSIKNGNMQKQCLQHQHSPFATSKIICCNIRNHKLKTSNKIRSTLRQYKSFFATSKKNRCNISAQRPTTALWDVASLRAASRTGGCGLAGGEGQAGELDAAVVGYGEAGRGAGVVAVELEAAEDVVAVAPGADAKWVRDGDVAAPVTASRPRHPHRRWLPLSRRRRYRRRQSR